MADTFSEFPNSNLVDAKIRNALTSKADKATTYTKTEVDTKIVGFVDGAEYDSTTKKILLKHGTTTVAEVDATSFIKDGMVSSVEVVGGNIVITFNTDAGLEPIEIPLTDIFDPDNYYDKTASDARFATKADATLTPIYSDTPTFSEWTFSDVSDGITDIQQPVFIPPTDGEPRWKVRFGYDGRTLTTQTFVTDEDATNLVFGYEDEGLNLHLTATRTRTDIIGYQLGSQTDKPLASEAEAEALRQGKLDKSGGTMTGTLTIAEVDGGGTEIIKAFLGSTSSQKFVIGVSGGNFYIGQYGYNLWLPYTSGTLALLSQIGIPAFDSTATYAVGAKVVYSNAIWNCATAVSTAGAWTGATNWTKLFDLDTGAPVSGGTKLITNGQVQSALASKANDSDVVHKTGNETIGGNKTFFGAVNIDTAAGGELKIDNSIDDASANFQVVYVDEQTGDILQVVIRDGLGNTHTVAFPNSSGNIALTAGTGHTGNLAALDANGNPTDSTIPAANVATKGDLPYAISESIPLTVTSGAASTTLDDRTHNVRTVAAPGSGNTTTITATLPAIVAGKSRDMFLNLTVGSAASDAGDISLSIVEPSGATVQIDIGSVEDIGIGKNEILISENALPTTSGNVTTTHWLVTVRHEDFAS